MTHWVVAKHCSSYLFYCTNRVETQRSIEPEPSNHNLLSKCALSLEVIKKKKTEKSQKHQKLWRKGGHLLEELLLSHRMTFKLFISSVFLMTTPSIWISVLLVERVQSLMGDRKVCLRDVLWIINSVSIKPFPFLLACTQTERKSGMEVRRDRLWNISSPRTLDWS